MFLANILAMSDHPGIRDCAALVHMLLIHETYSCGMETVSFRPEIVHWWRLLEDLPFRMGRIHCWLAADSAPDGDDMHQHHTVTLVACLSGVVRIAHPRHRIDLQPGDAVLIEAGAWHRHARVRHGTVAIGQGFMGGRSDWLLHTSDLQLVSSVPTEPSRQLLERTLAAHVEDQRRSILAEHLRGFITERSQPITAAHAAFPAMELAMWDNLHHGNVVEAMVQASGLSRAQAYRVFRTCSGVAPAQTVRRERIALARQLLKDGATATTAAERAGFADVRAMRRAIAGRVS